MSLSVENDPTSLFGGRPREGDAHEVYRPVSSTAVLSCILAGCSVLSLLNYWGLKAIPFFGVVAGLVALRRTTKYADEMSGRKAATIGLATSAFFLFAGSALSGWSYYTEVPDGAVRISYEQLKPSAESPNAAPAEAAALNGQKVFIKGYMFPTAHEKGITRFVLCRDNGDCCFGGQPPKSDMIFVQLVEPLDTEFTTRVRHVAGTFRVAGNRSSDVNQDVLYLLEADYIK